MKFNPHDTPIYWYFRLVFVPFCIAFLLFVGEPDIVDAFIHWLMGS